jgi:hypothetical protein
MFERITKKLKFDSSKTTISNDVNASKEFEKREDSTK